MDVESQNSDTVYSQHLGLHHYCNTALPDKPCRTFPDEEKDCDPNDRYFCSMWRTSGFLMSFATIAELATLVCFVVAIGGGQVKREYGWKVLCGLLSVVSVVQFAAMGLIVSSPRRLLCWSPPPGSAFHLLTVASNKVVPLRQRRILLRPRLEARHVLDSVHRQRQRGRRPGRRPGIMRLLLATRRRRLQLPRRPYRCLIPKPKV